MSVSIEQWRAWIETAHEAIEARIAQGEPIGTVACPRCGGSITYYSPYGHIHADCESEGCLSWRQ